MSLFVPFCPPKPGPASREGRRDYFLSPRSIPKNPRGNCNFVDLGRARRGRCGAGTSRSHLAAADPGIWELFGGFSFFIRDQRQVGHCCRFRHGAAPLFLGCFLVIFCKQLPKAAGMRGRRGQKSAESRAAKSSFRGECLYSKVFPREMRARNSRGWKSSWVWGKAFRFLWGFHFFVNYYSGTGSGFN